MNINPQVVDTIAKIVAVNAVATLVLAVMSYAVCAWILNGLAALDRWLDPSLKPGRVELDAQKEPKRDQPSESPRPAHD